jgi:hypothetical protein
MALHNGRLYHTEDEIEHINGIGKRVHKEHRSSLSRMNAEELFGRMFSKAPMGPFGQGADYCSPGGKD